LVWGGRNHSSLGSGSRYVVLDAAVDNDGDAYTECQGDCNDGNTAVHPGATETCDGIDDNCNGSFDEDASGVDSDSDAIHNACDNCRFAFNPTQLDSDGDGIGSACDNCALVANPAQADTDSDQRGNACDNCPTAYNPFQDDFDGDRAGDACDNCVLEFEPTQSDFDHDNQGDVCDLDDGLIFVFGTDDENYIEWQAETGPTSWNVYEGDLGVLRATGTYTQAPGSNLLAERHCAVADTWVEDLVVPPPGAVKFSLVTGAVGGIESGMGTNHAGVTRPNTNPCP
jgi:rubredoxin